MHLEKCVCILCSVWLCPSLLFETHCQHGGGWESGGGGDIEKSRADGEIITWKGAAIDYPALTDRQAVVGV